MALEPSAEQTADYVRNEAAARSIEQLIALVEAEVVRLHSAAGSFGEADLSKALDSEWTPLNCLSHVVSRTMVRAREVLYVALAGELPPPEEVTLPGDRDGLLAKHREAMDSLYAHVGEAPNDYKAFQWSHPAVGPMTWPEWLVFIQVHLADHAEQLESMAAAR